MQLEAAWWREHLLAVGEREREGREKMNGERDNRGKGGEGRGQGGGGEKEGRRREEEGRKGKNDEEWREGHYRKERGVERGEGRGRRNL